MSKAVDSQLRALSASPRYAIWIDAYLKSFPKRAKMESLSAQERQIAHFVDASKGEPISSSLMKQHVIKCKTEEELITELTTLFLRKDPIKFETLELARMALCESDISKHIREELDIMNMRTAVRLGYFFPKEIPKILKGFEAEIFVGPVLDYIQYFISYFVENPGKSDRQLLDFLEVFHPVFESIEQNIDAMMNSKDSVRFGEMIGSILTPVLQGLKIEHKRKVKSHICFDFMCNLVKYMLQQQTLKFAMNINNFFEFEVSLLQSLDATQYQKVQELACMFIEGLKKRDFIRDAQGCFKIGKLCLTIIQRGKKSYAEMFIGFMSWSVKSFPLAFVTLKDSDQKLERIVNMEPFKLTEGSNYMKTMKTVKGGQDASSFRVIEELGILYDLLPSLVQALEEDKKLMDVKRMTWYGRDTMTKSSMMMYIGFVAMALEKIDYLVNYDGKPDIDLRFLFEMDLFGVSLNLIPSKITGLFMTQMQRSVLNMCVKFIRSGEYTKQITIQAIEKQMQTLESRKKDYERLCFVYNLLPMFNNLVFSDYDTFMALIESKVLMKNILWVVENFFDTDKGRPVMLFLYACICAYPAQCFACEALVELLQKVIPNPVFTEVMFDIYLRGFKVNLMNSRVNLNPNVLVTLVTSLSNVIEQQLAENPNGTLVLDVMRWLLDKIAPLMKADEMNMAWEPIISQVSYIPSVIKTPESISLAIRFLKILFQNYPGLLKPNTGLDRMATGLLEARISDEDLEILSTCLFGATVPFGQFAFIANPLILSLVIPAVLYSDEHIDYMEKLICSSPVNAYVCSYSDAAEIVVKLYCESGKEQLYRIAKALTVRYPTTNGLRTVIKYIPENPQLMKFIESTDKDPTNYVMFNNGVEISNPTNISESWSIGASVFYANSEEEFVIFKMDDFTLSLVNNRMNVNGVMLHTEFAFNTWHSFVVQVAKDRICLLKKGSDDEVNYGTVEFDDSFDRFVIGSKNSCFAYFYLGTGKQTMPFTRIAFGFDTKLTTNTEILATVNVTSVKVPYSGKFITASKNMHDLFTVSGIWKGLIDVIPVLFSEPGRNDLFETLITIMQIVSSNPPAISAFCDFGSVNDLTEALEHCHESYLTSYLIDKLMMFSYKMKPVHQRTFMTTVWLNINIWNRVSEECFAKYEADVIRKCLADKATLKNLLEDASVVSAITVLMDEHDAWVPILLPPLKEIILEVNTENLYDSFLCAMMSVRSAKMALAFLNFYESELSAGNEVFVEVIAKHEYLAPLVAVMCACTDSDARMCYLESFTAFGWERAHEFVMKHILSLTGGMKMSEIDSVTFSNYIFDDLERQKHHEWLPFLCSLASQMSKESATELYQRIHETITGDPDSREWLCSIPHWQYWLVLLVKYATSEETYVQEVSQFLSTILHDSFQKCSFEITRSTLQMLDVTSLITGFDFRGVKKNILFNCMSTWGSENRAFIIPFLFSTIFLGVVGASNKFTNPETFDSNEIAAKCEVIGANIALLVRLHNNDWVDADAVGVIMSHAMEFPLSRVAFTSSVSIEIIQIIGFLVLTHARTGTFNSTDIPVKVRILLMNNDWNSWDEGVHRFIGMLLHGLSQVGDAEGLDRNELLEMFNAMDDDVDSPEFQTFLFEEWLLNNKQIVMCAEYLDSC